MEAANTKELQTALTIQKDIQVFLQNLIGALETVLDASVLDRIKERLMTVEQKIATLITMIRSTVAKAIAPPETAPTQTAQPAAASSSDTDRVSAGSETTPSGVHPKIFAAYQKQLRGKSLSQIYDLYQKLKQLPTDYYLKNKLSEEILARHVEAYTIGWLLAADNLQTHAHTDNQLKNQVLGKMHPALKALRFDDNSEYRMAMFSTIWKKNVTLRKTLHAIRDQIHDSEAVH